jgi:mannose-1-phosphate guanylyltransferase / phosphomannomutase
MEKNKAASQLRERLGVGGSMRAMVMAAGAGTRLRPLTYAVPKPMVPIANRPVLEYTLLNLLRHQITDVVLNLHAYPEMIREYFGDGAAWGMRIRYAHESKLMGTAGGVKKNESFLGTDTFLVMSGDGLTSANLTELVQFHKKRKALATMALKAVDVRFDYGITITNKNGRINQFVEKPMWGEVFSNMVNTGIYVFEPRIFSKIPAKTSYDFGHQVWPSLLKAKEPIFGHATKEYWCDVGNLQEYRKAQHDALDEKAGIALPGKQVRRGIWIDDGAIIERDVKLEAPCLIGKGCRIAAGSTIGPYTVIGHRANIGSKTTIRNSILWNDVRVARGVTLENCVIGHNALVRENITVYEGAVINIPS